jgi:hypothetical protein
LGDFLRCAHVTDSSRFRAGSRHWINALFRPYINQSLDQIPRRLIFVNSAVLSCCIRESA